MAITLYTSRVVLNTLGVVDFGIYNVVGGVVMMFQFINGAMTNATQRFLSYEIGRKNNFELNRVYSMSINIHIMIALLILILAETFGLWFVKSQLIIPLERLNAAIWVYHFSVFSLIITILGVPYNASIIANEKMQAFALISIVEVVLKLIIVFILLSFSFDKLKLYAVLTFVVVFLISIIYKYYCKHSFIELKYQKYWDKELFVKMFSFASWSLWGNLGYVGYTTGINILLNIFFGPTINAARGIANQVNGALNNFASNFRVAINPQIVKSYASKDIEYMNNLVFKSSKYSFFLLFTLALPVLIETDVILKLWLKIVPDYTSLFTRLVLISTMIDCIAASLTTTAHATGKIKKFQLVTGCLFLSILPISYVLLKLGNPPQITHYVNIVISIIVLVLQVYMVSRLVSFSKIDFTKQVIVPIITVSIVASVLPIIIYMNLDNKLIRFVIVCVVSMLSTLITIYFVGMNVKERQYIARFILNRKKKSNEKTPLHH